ncbi:MAG TPA: AbrB/MazE/SpoVT family DNA-binding domain-containing protein [Candidatus Saccharibacteria bacterium]|nr:AbrB/MazE/SpoVT family DNA-binding domain-containing protein [Candidatus Saccharibacteria bacterium]HRK93797.1 AbrB/MazE/SpoVT family DNA-binding domain-containing protein [Candidatus Saccharibacteria bacterium]
MGLHDKKLYGTATVGTKGQVVIPSDAREELEIKTGDRLYVIGSPSRKFVGFIKEEQLRELVEHIASDMDSFKKFLTKKD